MKTLFVSLAAFLFAFFVGCQSSITDPVAPELTQSFSNADQETVAYKDAFSFTYPNQLMLEGILIDPSHRPNGYADIHGVVRYGIREVKGGLIAANTPEFYKTSSNWTSYRKFKVDIYVNADLKGGHNHAWSVEQAASQTIIINSGNPNNYIQEKFKVKNTCCAPLNLVLTFRVNGKELKFVSKELKIPEGWSPISAEE